MNAKLTRLFSFVLILAVALALVGAGGFAFASKPAGAAASLLQFAAGGHVLGFDARGAYVANGSHSLRVDFVRAKDVQPQSDTAAANGKAAPLSRVVYAGLWEGVSLEYASLADGVYFTTYTLAPGADVKQIRLRYNAPLALNKDGTLTISFERGSFTESAPIAWQEMRGQRVPVNVSFRLRGQEVGFALGAYDRAYAVTIDPTLIWNTFLGGSDLYGGESGHGIAVDSSGNSYVAGRSEATWGSPVRGFTSGGDAFVAKLDSSGVLVWNTFLGGSGSDSGLSIALDTSGNIYVSGLSTATWGAPERAYTSGADGFVAKLDSSGGLSWNTFLGGSGSDNGMDITWLTSLYVTGKSTVSWGSPLRAYTALDDGYVAKLDSSTGALSWNTFLGGSGSDYGNGIAISSSTIYVVGISGATWGAPISPFPAGAPNAYAAKLDTAGGLTWHTFFGGGGVDSASDVAVPSAGFIYVAGDSNATWGSPIRAYSGDYDAYVAKIDSGGSLTWNTFLGSSATDYGYDIAGNSDHVYVTGRSAATWATPIRPYTGGNDAFVAKVYSNGSMVANTFLGGSGGDDGNGIAVSASQVVYVTGSSSATWGSPKRAFSGASDAYAAKLANILTTTFRSEAANDGWTLESTETSNVGGTINSSATTFIVGDNAADKQYRSILSFDTSSLPDTAVITKVTLKIKKQGLVGTDPFTILGLLRVDVRKPYFGSSAALAAGDFQAAASKNSVGTIPNTPVSNWYSKIWTSGISSYINLGGLTQFRLRFATDDDDNSAADHMKFYSGNYAGVASRPTIVIEYYIP